MSKISLRAYNREIGALIERGHTEEAIAHSKYILKTYPKHLDTYHLLGKAFLENQRYGEAADILTRILSVIPDDFVAQIGMSIIREDEGNLDAAIFHMERSFEIQPSNAAIQDELRRLYGRRDGIEPPKLRLTRGALVRMYSRGDLYRQAIAEARTALKEDPQRLDLEIILARMYYQTGQKAEAAEICSRLVLKLPYCLEANRILADVLPETSRSEDAKIYQQRLVALEPYLAYQSDPSQSILQIPDNAVTLDRLEWIPGLDSAQQPAWVNTLGLEIDEKEKEQVPDWLSNLSDEKDDSLSEAGTALPLNEEQETFPAAFTSTIDDATAAEPQSQEAKLPGFDEETQESLPEEKLPDWMRGIGETAVVSEEESLPDWMQDKVETPAASEEEKPLDMLQETGDIPDAPAEEKLPEWMQSSGWKITENQSEDLTTSVTGELEESGAAPADIPGWLKDLAPTPSEENIKEKLASSVELPAVESVLPPTPAAGEEELPDWLKSPASSPEETFNIQSQEPLPDWLIETRENLDELAEPPASIDIGSDVDQTVAQTQPTAATIDQEIRDNSVEANVSAVSGQIIPEPSPDMENMDDAMAWLESLAAKQGADEETLITKPEERVETPPDWVMQAAASAEAPLADPEMEIPSSEEIKPLVVDDELTSQAEVTTPQTLDLDQAITAEVPVVAEENVQPEPSTGMQPVVPEQVDQTDMDSAFAWLESLAEKQGAEPDSLIVPSEDRLENPPDWIQQESMEFEGAVEQKSVEPVEVKAEPVEQLPESLASTDQIEVPAAEIPALDDSMPDWHKEESVTTWSAADIDAARPITEDIMGEADVTEIPIEVIASEETLIDWTKEPDLEEIKPEPPFESPAIEPAVEEQAAAPGIVVPVEPVEPEPLPDWLSSDLPLPSAALKEPLEQDNELQTLPDWLQVETPFADHEPGDSQVSMDSGETPPLPDWLKDLESEQEGHSPTKSGFEAAPAVTHEIGEIGQAPDDLILQAQSALANDQVDSALSIYQRLIEQDQMTDETIHDLRDALYRFPVDSAIWQTLGDAYMRTNQVQEALDAFTKAEELLK